MDNLCHSLVGMALGRAGLNRRTALATSTLVIANNLPDVDVARVRDQHPRDVVPPRLDPRRARATDAADRAHRRDAALRPLSHQANRPTGQRANRPSRQARAIAAALVPWRAAARVHGFHQQLRRAPADAVLGAMVLRRRALYRRSLAVPDAWARDGGWRSTSRVRRASAWRWRRSTCRRCCSRT